MDEFGIGDVLTASVSDPDALLPAEGDNAVIGLPGTHPPVKRTADSAAIVEDKGAEHLVARYFHDVRQFPLLTRAEEQTLFKRLEAHEDRVCRILHLAPTTRTALAALRRRIASGDVTIEEVIETDESDDRALNAFYTALDDIEWIFARLDYLKERVYPHGRSPMSVRNLRVEHRTLMREANTTFVKEIRLSESGYALLRSALEEQYRACPSRSLHASYIALTRAEARRKAVFDTIVCSNTRLAIDIAKVYRGRGVPFLDMIQEANIGLMHAVHKFERERGLKYCTYATWWARQAIIRSFSRLKRVVRFPAHVEEGMWRFLDAFDELTDTLERRPTPRELAAHLDWPLGQVESKLDALTGCYRAISLERPYEKDGHEGISLLDALPDTSVTSLEVRETTRAMQSAIAHAFDGLSERERFIAERRFGLNGHRPHTLEEIGILLDLSRERVRQIESKDIMPKLEKALAPYCELRAEFLHDCMQYSG